MEELKLASPRSTSPTSGASITPPLSRRKITEIKVDWTGAVG
jgi:hypothetical protein